MKTTPGLRFKKFVAVEDGIVEGYAARFNERDLAGDVITAGAFTRSIRDIERSGHRLPLLLGHESSEVLGSWSELREDSSGLWAVGTINTDVERGREVLSLVKRGDLSGLSIGFAIPDGGRTIRNGVPHLTEITLLEISLVAIPAAPLARVSLKDLSDLSEFSELLRYAGAPRREAELIARKSFPALQSNDDAEHLDHVAAGIEATIRTVKSLTRR